MYCCQLLSALVKNLHPNIFSLFIRQERQAALLVLAFCSKCLVSDKRLELNKRATRDVNKSHEAGVIGTCFSLRL